MSIEHKLDKSFDDGIRYTIIGSGKNLVLVHGWGATSAIWSPVVKQLSAHYCLHLVDLPGVSHQPELNDYSLEKIADTLLEKLPDNAIWCGWSLGGLIATYIASNFPERVEKLIQVCSSLKFVEDESWLGMKEEVFGLFKVGMSLQPKKTLNRFLSLQTMGSETVKSDITTVKYLLADQPESKLSALIAGLDLLENVDLRNEFSQLTIPCLIVLGEKDSLVPIDNARTLLSLYPSQQQLIFKKSSHVPFISEPDLFVNELINFIK